jgi:hypothetical protein
MKSPRKPGARVSETPARHRARLAAVRAVKAREAARAASQAAKDAAKAAARSRATRAQPSVALRLMSAGVRKSHAYMIANGHRKPSLPLALDVVRKTGLALGPLEGLSPTEVAALAQLPEQLDADKPPLVLALDVYSQTGVAVGPLADLNQKQIGVIADLHGEPA